MRYLCVLKVIVLPGVFGCFWDYVESIYLSGMMVLDQIKPTPLLAIFGKYEK